MTDGAHLVSRRQHLEEVNPIQTDPSAWVFPLLVGLCQDLIYTLMGENRISLVSILPLSSG